ncbi:hypothetical protein KJ782_05085 [Patescibacteria group bacterium]|nr:hypothetical protein [Patescibacteria group bacterium]
MAMCVVSSKDTRTVIAEAFETIKVYREISKLDPQSEAEFWVAYELAMNIRVGHWSRFGPDSDTIVGLLTRSMDEGDGKGTWTPRPYYWAPDNPRQGLVYRANEYVRWSTLRFDPMFDEQTTHAWGVNSFTFWVKLGISVLAGGGFIALGIMFLPYFVCLLIIGLVLVGRLNVLPADLPFLSATTEKPVTNLVNSDGGDDLYPDDQGDVADIVQIFSLCLVLLVCWVRLPHDLRRTLEVVRCGLSRAPPQFERRLSCCAL